MRVHKEIMTSLKVKDNVHTLVSTGADIVLYRSAQFGIIVQWE